MLPFLLVVFAAAVNLAAAAGPTYPYCDRTFSCGSITNATFPFTGGDRPTYCGPPEFALTCRDGSIAELTYGLVAYRALELDEARRTVLLARSDLYSDSCTSEFRTTTLNSTYFSYGGPQNEVLSLFYGCSPSPANITPYNRFSCSSSVLNFTDDYYLLAPVPRDSILWVVNCSANVSVPMSMEAGNSLAVLNISLGQALREGFAVSYSVPNEGLCTQCNELGGYCGFDLGQTICICDDDRPCSFPLTPLPHVHPADAPSPFKERNPSITRRDIALIIAGAVLAGAGLGWLILYYRQHRKKRLVSLSAQMVDREIKTFPSSKRFMSSSNKLIHSVSPYPYSKSDLGRGSSHFSVQVFNCSELEEATNNFDPSMEIGDGGFGAVYRGVLTDGCTVAVKRLYDNNFNRLEQFMNEVKILTRLSHRNLIKLYGCTSRRSRELLLVYEYVPNGTLAEHLHGRRAGLGLLVWPVRLDIAVQTAEALAYLHRSNVIHRDIKTSNILLDKDFKVKVADFGLSRPFPSGASHVSTGPQGTPGYVLGRMHKYVDPEYHQCYKLTEKSDVYSFGVVLIELISSLRAVDTSRHRHDVNLSGMALSRIQGGRLPELVDPSIGFGTDGGVRREVTMVAELAFTCLQGERDMRPSMDEVLEGLRGIRDDVAEIVEIMDGDGDDVELLQEISALGSPESVRGGGSGLENRRNVLV